MQEEIHPEVNIYTDGGADPNPGKGGFGVVMTYKGYKKEFSQGYQLTTNNRMELMAVIFGLEQLKKTSIVRVFSDSKYVVDGISKGWAEKWKSKNWYRTRTEKAINSDLWARLLELISQHISVTVKWVKGHDGHKENERCDYLATLALNGTNLIEDIGYKNSVEIINKSESPHESAGVTRKGKILNEGDSCRKCNTPVIKKQTKKRPLKSNQNYFFEYYLFCPNCKTMYMVEAAKRLINDRNDLLF